MIFTQPGVNMVDNKVPDNFSLLFIALLKIPLNFSKFNLIKDFIRQADGTIQPFGIINMLIILGRQPINQKANNFLIESINLKMLG